MSSTSGSPLSNTPVYYDDRYPRWMKRTPGHPKYISELSNSQRLFDHHGQTIVGGRVAFVTEPYTRGMPEILDLAGWFAELSGTNLGVCYPTWHGYSTMRFAWIGPKSVKPTKYLSRFVAAYSEFGQIAHELVRSLPSPWTKEEEIALFWRPLWPRLARMTYQERDGMNGHAKCFLQWWKHETTTLETQPSIAVPETSTKSSE